MKMITTRQPTPIERLTWKHNEIPEKPVNDDNIPVFNHKRPVIPKSPIVPEDRKNVYGTQTDLANAEMILGDQLYKYIHSDVAGFTLPAFTANDIIVGGTGAPGGIGDVNLNGAVRLAGANRDLTAQAVANYVNPINVYGGTVDINNAKNILGSTGYNYMDSSQAGFALPSFTSNDIVVGGTGATGGIPDVYLNGANRLAGINRDATAETIRKYRDSKRVYGDKVDIDIAQSILGNDNYTYIRSDLPGFKLPIFCSNNIIVGGTGASGGIPDVNPNGAVRLAGANRDETAEAIRRYAGVPDVPPGNIKRQRVVDFAKQFEGKIPYHMDSNITTQILDLNHLPPYMDCADFTSSVYFTVLNINIGPNTYAQITRGTDVPKDESKLKLGDLILFDWQGDGVSDHVGMYIGNGKYINESGTNAKGGNVREGNVTDVWDNIMSIRRIIQDDGSLVNN